MGIAEAYRILIVDDNRAIHEDFDKILGPDPSVHPDLEQAAAALFGEPMASSEFPLFDIDSVFQGQDALLQVRQANAEGRPYSLAFVDVHMPPGWDGVETIGRLWQECPQLQVVICTAYSDYSWNEMIGRLGHSDRFLILKKPFDTIEVRQLAWSLTQKWNLAQEAAHRVDALEAEVAVRTTRLQQMRQHTELLLNCASQGIFGLDVGGFCTFINPAAARLLGYPEADLLGSLMHDTIHHKKADGSPYHVSQCPMVQAVQDGMASAVAFPEVFWRLDGTCFPVEYSSTPVVQEGSIVGVVVIFTDVTERVELERQVRESQKLEAVGQLAAGLAHDFNNLLTIILCNAQLATEHPSDDDLEAQMEDITEAGQRAAGLTRQLLTFSREQTLTSVPLDIVEVVTEVGRMLARLLGDDIELTLDTGQSSLPMTGDRGMLEQVIVNLAVNARDAMPDGGRLSICTGMTSVPSLACSSWSNDTNDPCIFMSFADSGCGMDPDTLSRIFEPFYTTKEVGKGTGLGLSTVHGIIRQHQGYIGVQTAPRCGSTFTVYLPMEASKRHVESTPQSPGLELVGGRETILLVEDEPTLRRLARLTLERLGYHILAVSSARDALPIWEQHRDRIDLLLTDLIMPGGLNGWQLSRALLTDRPGLCVVYTSGYSQDILRGKTGLRHGLNFLPKPYHPASLAAIVRQQLDSRRGWPDQTEGRISDK